MSSLVIPHNIFNLLVVMEYRKTAFSEALTAGGLLSLKRRHRKDGSLGSYEYTVHLPAPHAASPPACGAAHESTSPEATISSSLRSEEELDVGAREQLTVAEAKPEIAKEFGGRDHTTIIYGCDKIKALMKERHSVYDDVTTLIHEIKSG